MKNQNNQPTNRPNQNSKFKNQNSLKRGLGFWELTFASQRAIFKHEQGALYVDYLLTHPGESFHGLALALKASANGEIAGAATEMVDPATGETVIIDKGAILEDRHLWLDHAERIARLRRKVRQLDGIMQDRNERDAVKAELHQQIEGIEQFLRDNLAETKGTAEKAVRAVRRAINRFHTHLAKAKDTAGQPHPVLAQFAQHIEKHILIPSARYSDRPGARARTGLAGCFTYEPPPGVTWA